MKSFKQMMAEVAQPEPEEEKAFKAQHKVVVNKHPVALDHQHTGEIAKPKAKRKADQEGDANYDMAYESVEQLDEIGDTSAGKKKLKNLIVNRTQKVADAGASLERRPEKAAEYDKAQKRHMKTIGRAATRLAKEEVEQLDELSPNTLHSYIKKASGNLAGNSAANAAIAATQVDKPKSQKADRKGLVRNVKNRMRGITSASGRLADKANMAENMQEEIPMMMNQLAFICYAAEEISGMLKLGGDPEEWFQNKLAAAHSELRGLYTYMQGERQMGESFSSEMNKASKKAHADAAEKRKKMGPVTSDTLADINAKLGNTKSSKKKNEACSTTKKMKEELSPKQKKIDHNKNGKIDGQDLAMIRAKKKNESSCGTTKKMKEEVCPECSEDPCCCVNEAAQIDELSQDTLRNYHGKAGADLQAKRKKLEKGTLTSKDYKQGRNRAAGLNRAANKMEEVQESVETLDEAFKAGIVKFKDNTSMVLKKEDADILNKMFKSMSAGSVKKMTETAMKDKKGFAEILDFAKEAM